ncbi:4Fe-4S dicluster domain-containing protein [Desulfurobacterium pacificum]|uniref:4Fe-4S dicluster domain-containing protein n=1 Tax=Desulfurobacterium pacificum TaxID=240166 RepID=A0ABY1NNA4_9BACT|nr:4Fe-4S binding protein [Desulfurobacterium pacificum]SMP14142.1 4Fe-4S dicluster domain-containing protein [Desulfurobacterium pacificum]
MKEGDFAEKKSLILCQDGSPFIPYYPAGINTDKCTGCGECVKVCPQNCIELKEQNGKLVAVIVDMESCIGDGMCRLVCPEDAFT